jgi:hypothetical protein
MAVFKIGTQQFFNKRGKPSVELEGVKRREPVG